MAFSPQFDSSISHGELESKCNRVGRARGERAQPRLRRPPRFEEWSAGRVVDQFSAGFESSSRLAKAELISASNCSLSRGVLASTSECS